MITFAPLQFHMSCNDEELEPRLKMFVDEICELASKDLGVEVSASQVRHHLGRWRHCCCWAVVAGCRCRCRCRCRCPLARPPPPPPPPMYSI
jgi:hypothetical protein